MKEKLIIAIAAVMIVASVGAVAAFAFSAKAATPKEEQTIGEIRKENVPETEDLSERKTEGEGLSDTTCEPQREYTYLRGTMYKNLYETRRTRTWQW